MSISKNINDLNEVEENFSEINEPKSDTKAEHASDEKKFSRL